jgi:hypothetical protein
MKNTTEQFRHPGNFATKTRRHEEKRNRSVIIIFFLFFISSLAAQEIPNGIYLLSSPESRSFYPGKDSVVVTDAHDHKITLLVMPGPFFGEKDIYYSDYTLAFNEHNKNDYWCFEFSLVERGNVKRNELIERGAVLPFVFVFNEKAIAFGKLFQKGDGPFLHLGAMCNYGEIEIPFQVWSKNLHANFDKQWNPLTRDSVYYYTNGKPAEDHFFRNGDHTENREWYYNGKIKEVHFDSAGLSCSREYFPSGRLEKSEWRKGNSKREDWYIFRLSEEGKIQFKDSCYSVNKISFEEKCYYDSAGILTGKEFIRYLDYLPGEVDEMNNPMVVGEQEYEKGLLKEERESFWTSTESGGENSGTWKYYENGKLLKTEKYPDWKVFYKKAGGKI